MYLCKLQPRTNHGLLGYGSIIRATMTALPENWGDTENDTDDLTPRDLSSPALTSPSRGSACGSLCNGGESRGSEPTEEPTALVQSHRPSEGPGTSVPARAAAELPCLPGPRSPGCAL